MENNFEIKIYENIDMLYKDLYSEIKSLIINLKKPILGLATGSSPLKLYKLMSDGFKKESLDYINLKTFNLDEYIGLGKYDEQSYSYFMWNNLFKNINILEKNINLIDGKCKDVNKEIKRYQKRLDRAGAFDIQILGIGTDGHIGFNEPGTSIDSNCHMVYLDMQTIKDNSRFFNNLSDVPKSAITMGVKDILKAKRICLIATGDKKIEPIKKFVFGDITNKFPASYLKRHNNVCLYLDKTAATEILKNKDFTNYIVK